MRSATEWLAVGDGLSLEFIQAIQLDAIKAEAIAIRQAVPELRAVAAAAEEVSGFGYCTSAVFDDYRFQSLKSTLRATLAELDAKQSLERQEQARRDR
jgi:hypothetical protein